MGATNYAYYTDNQIELSNCFKSLGHPARVAIVELLCQYEEMNLSDLNAFIPLCQSNISRHCRELFLSGILVQTNIKNKSFYKINRERFTPLIKYLLFVRSLNKRIDIPLSFIHYHKTTEIDPRIKNYRAS